MKVKDDLSIFWDILKNVVFVMGILLFFLGWVYLSYYFKNFGIAITDIKTDVFTYYLYGFSTLLNFWTCLVTFLATCIIILIYYNREKLPSFYLWIIITVIFLFPLEYFAAKKTAENKVHAMLNGKQQVYPIIFSFEKEYLNGVFTGDSSYCLPMQSYHVTDTAILNSFIANMRDFKIKQFYEDKDNYYVFVNPNNRSSANNDISIQVYALKKEHINFSYLIIDQSSKK